MTQEPLKPPTTNATPRWWVAWGIIALLVIGGVILALRLGPRLTPLLDALR